MNHWHRKLGRGAALTLILGLTCFDAVKLAGQEIGAPIVLRDLTLIRGKTITEFDDASIVLSDGTRLTWDQILKAQVQEDRQQEFDLKIKQLGLPLFRLKSRIGNGDWAGAGEIAVPIYDSSIAKGHSTSDVDTEYLVCLATMKARLEKSDRAGALIPFIRAAQLQANISDSVRGIVGTHAIPQRDRELGLSRELLPVWFDESQVEETSRQLSELLSSMATENGSPPPGVTVYLASLKLELGQTEEALRLLGALNSESDAELDSWQIVLESRLHQKTNNALNAQTMLELNANKTIGNARPVSLYYRGINVINQRDTSDLDRSKAILTLLRIPALYGNAHPDLAAAAIYHAAEIAKLRGRIMDEQKLREELLRRYPRTYHGRMKKNNVLADDVFRLDVNVREGIRLE